MPIQAVSIARGRPALRRAASLVLLALGVALFPGAGRAQSPPPAAGPHIVWDAKMQDVGIVVQGETVHRVFRFRNQGSETLTIQRVRPSCGCTAAITSASDLPPGGSGEIAVDLDSRGRLGYQDIQVIVWSNDPVEMDRGPNTSVLTLRGEIITLYEAAPAAAYFDPFLFGQGAEQTVTVLPREANQGFDVISAESASRYVTVGAEPYQAGNRRGTRLTVRVLPEAPPGRIETLVTLTTTLPRQPTVGILVVATVHYEIVWYPDRLMFYTVTKGTEVERTFTLDRVQGTGLPIDAIEADERLFTVDVRPLVADRRAEVAVRVRPDAPAGVFHENIRVFFRDRLLPVVEIPAFGEVTRQVVCRPGGIYFEAAPGSTEVLGEVVVERPDAGPLQVSGATTDVAGVRVEVLPEEGANRFVVRVHGTAGLAAGAVAGNLTVETNVAGEERIVLSLRGRVG